MTRTAWAITIGVVLLIVLIVGASALIPFVWGRGIGGGYMGRGMMGGFGSPFMFMGGIGMILFWVLLIGGAIWFVQALGRASRPTKADLPSVESPLDILKRRYAKGEITKEQFEEMKNDLGT
jgi:putative membrane protein